MDSQIPQGNGPSNNNTKAILISVAVIIIFAAFVVYYRLQGAPAATAPSDPSTQTSATETPTPSDTIAAGTPTPTSPGASPTPTPTTSAGKFKDGSYTGPVTDAVYGKIQVKAVISGGKLTDVIFLQFPDSPGHTTEVSNFALPQLKSEAIVAQSANVDIVSGATQDSEAFQQSLAAALAQA